MKIILTLCALLLAASAQARDYYVANGGSDSGPGTITNPWATISKVQSTSFEPGDRILFKGGDSFDGDIRPTDSGTAEKPITYSTYGEGRANLTNSGDDECWSLRVGHDHFVVSNFNMVNCAVNIYVDGGALWPAEHILFENISVDQAAQTAWYLSGASNITVRNAVATNVGTQHGMYIDGFLGAGTGFLVENFHVDTAPAGCIQVNSNGVGRLSNVVIRYSYLRNCDSSGINNIGGNAAQIYHNIIEVPKAGIYNGCNTQFPCDDTGAIDTVIENNTIKIEGGTGYSVCLSNYNGNIGTGPAPSVASFRNNVCIFNRDNGQMLELYHDSAINAIVDNNLWWTDTENPADMTWDYDGVVYTGFANYQAAGKEPNSDFADPDFITSMGTDYYPNVGSPALELGGTTSVGATRDYAGVPVPFGAAIDAGAVEGGGQSIPNPPQPGNVSLQ